jgi:isoquinoline 1-oxidoreductase alpha subunit
MIELNVNGKTRQLDMHGSTPLLWALRDNLGLTGTKYSCGIAVCGACTVLVDGQAMRACVTPVSAVAGRKIVTIEAVAGSRVGKAVQQAWRKLEVVQCGFCQSGQILAAAALIAKHPKPSDADIDREMGGNLCRCATYARIRAAIKEAAKSLA